MLILGRYKGEEIVIGDHADDRDNVVIKIIGIERGQFRIGIQAPRGITVNRREIHDRIKLERTPS